MQVQNSLARKSNESVTTFTVGNDTVTLSPSIVRNYLTNGNGAVTDQEVNYFVHLCRGQGLNPFLKEIYLIKFGQQPATFVVSKEAFLKRAEANSQYDGAESGIIVMNGNGEIIERKGGFFLKGSEQVVGGWAKVYRKDRKYPSDVQVTFEEYAGRTKDGNLNSNWANRPATMIKKVALVQALREAFPNDLNNLYTEEEQGDIQMPMVDTTPIEQPKPVQQNFQQPVQQQVIEQDIDLGDSLV
nr:MAG TPA: RecT protein [Caudoviricetes sp.]